MQIRHTFQGKESVYETTLTKVIVGRPKAGVTIDLDLTPDHSVSRPHAKIFRAEDAWWIEDLESGWGTKLEGKEIKGQGRMRLVVGSTFRVGDTTLVVDALSLDDATQPASADVKAPMDRTIAYPAPDLSVSLSPLLPAGDPVMMTAPLPESTAIRHQRLLYSLLLEFGTEAPLDQLLQYSTERLIAAIPAAERGAAHQRFSHRPVVAQGACAARSAGGQFHAGRTRFEQPQRIHLAERPGPERQPD